MFQLQLARDRNAVPLTRDYVGKAEAQLARRELELPKTGDVSVAA